MKRETSRNFLSWPLALLIYWPVIVLVSLILEPISLLAGVFDKSGHARHKVVWLWSAICLKLVADVSIRGLEKIDPTKPRLYVANHLSAMDIPLLYRYLPFQFRIMAHHLVFRVPLVGWWLRMSGSLEISPESVALSRRALKAAIESLRRGMPVAIFPEGERAPQGEMLPFKPGAFYVAVKAQVDIVPMAILGTYEALPIGSTHLRRERLQFIVGAPISVAGYTTKDLPALAERVQSAVRELYRSGGPQRLAAGNGSS